MFRVLRSLDIQQLIATSTRNGCDTLSRFFQENIDKLLIILHRTTAVDPEPGEINF